ncbi:hypothetical protein [Kingella sp. (in: b-proteobacteria)]|uniref:hypothetical protein n=1 Tax=Kingella sp. (in: b-proteobacteria) TaxID=2020713 RepID=UPI0026DAE38B|nr:hypothetical protein [Kingella sp. (in: b-proteobacteria)]MDO4657845.1 hypothetical protein [Kingella sp. (in: b-proteobacteria)]
MKSSLTRMCAWQPENGQHSTNKGVVNTLFLLPAQYLFMPPIRQPESHFQAAYPSPIKRQPENQFPSFQAAFVAMIKQSV